ncbi:PEP-CTERM sorting domain-containing protein [Pelagibius sp. Alg239-R121]|uniref:PEP-CTERM sorting domain-containing protein n=1 Tax=Pelagibius sp. Alg239-R121 TaxID=2993448 RepID=UPI0024A6F09B|nr:PEP-CTERM sorting domain-containing protein [Pelagibius sp. Alg239-R121]
MHFRSFLPNSCFKNLLGVLAGGSLFLSTSAAHAGLCGAAISTDWTEFPRENQTVTPTFEASGFVGCGTTSIFSGFTETVYGGGGIDQDAFNISVEALDDNSLRLSAQSINLNEEDTHAFPSVTVMLSDIAWLDGPGEIVDVLFADGTTHFEAIDFTTDSITFEWGLFSVGGGVFFPNEITLFADFDIVATHTAVPEPGTMLLFGLGLAGLGFVRRGNSKASHKT